MPPTSRVYLIGPRASGKSTLGAALAKQLDWTFADSGALLEASCGSTLSEFIFQYGWEEFRSQESRILQNNAPTPAIIATGGGMVLRDENRRFMREHGLVIYLCAPAEILTQRLMVTPQASQRPSLTGEDPALEVARILRERLPLYEACAHHQIDVTQPFHKCLDTLRQLVKEHAETSSHSKNE